MKAFIPFFPDEDRKAYYQWCQEANASDNYPQPLHIYFPPFLFAGGVVTGYEVIPLTRQDNHTKQKHDDDGNYYYYHWIGGMNDEYTIFWRLLLILFFHILNYNCKIRQKNWIYSLSR